MKKKVFGFVCLALAAASMVVVPAAHASTAQERATQVAGQPNTFYWAVLVGISKYDGKTPQLPGAANDARNMASYLKSLGWRDDHIFLITDGGATRDMILRGIRWLAAKTNNKSAAIFHFSGHEMPFHTTADGDNESQDVAMRTRENKFILDGEFGKELAKVHAVRMWIDMSLCRAAGFSDAGTLGKGRVATYASAASELAYEDSGNKQSVFSYFQLTQAMKNRQADRNKDGHVTVEEAFWWSRQPVWDRTSNKQHPQINDQQQGDFIVKPPAH